MQDCKETLHPWLLHLDMTYNECFSSGSVVNASLFNALAFLLHDYITSLKYNTEALLT